MGVSVQKDILNFMILFIQKPATTWSRTHIQVYLHTLEKTGRGMSSLEKQCIPHILWELQFVTTSIPKE